MVAVPSPLLKRETNCALVAGVKVIKSVENSTLISRSSAARFWSKLTTKASPTTPPNGPPLEAWESISSTVPLKGMLSLEPGFPPRTVLERQASGSVGSLPARTRL